MGVSIKDGYGLVVIGFNTATQVASAGGRVADGIDYARSVEGTYALRGRDSNEMLVKRRAASNADSRLRRYSVAGEPHTSRAGRDGVQANPDCEIPRRIEERFTPNCCRALT
jgi:hypothetical protein